MTHKRRKNSP